MIQSSFLQFGLRLQALCHAAFFSQDLRLSLSDLIRKAILVCEHSD